MATPLATAPAPLTTAGPARPRGFPLAVGLSIALVVLLRLLQIHNAPTPDEGGFLVVASQWSHGDSLYGDYWVDRPPLLIGIFRLAGGLVGLRLIGTLAVGVAIWMLASTSDRIFGRRAATWTAVTAAALLVSPYWGSLTVDGELLALPLVALGLRAAVEAVVNDDRIVSRASGLVTGAAAVAALLVKQNMLDVVVFAAVAWAVACRHGRISGRRLAETALWAVLGTIVTGSLVALYALYHGTDLAGVWNAMYPFRFHVAELIGNSFSSVTTTRLGHLVGASLLTGAPLILGLMAVFGVRRSPSRWMVAGLAALLVYDAGSIFAGGSYWLHYLVEATPLVALSAGAVARRAPKLLRAAVAVVTISALVSFGIDVAQAHHSHGVVVGRALAKSAHRSDTIFSAFGDSEILQITGMSSSYPYLWSLPSRVLDPDLKLLRGNLAGPHPPTWVIVRPGYYRRRLDKHGALAVIEDRYRAVADICGRKIYLIDGVRRPAVPGDGACGTGADS